jgi:hypothetical protein
MDRKRKMERLQGRVTDGKEKYGEEETDGKEEREKEETLEKSVDRKRQMIK